MLRALRGTLRCESNWPATRSSRERSERERSVVEMPGVEPGSNVYAEGLYDHGPLISPCLQREPEKGRRDGTIFRNVAVPYDSPTSLVTFHLSSEDQERNEVRIESD